MYFYLLSELLSYAAADHDDDADDDDDDDEMSENVDQSTRKSIK